MKLEKTLTFLKSLKQNNNREWFAKHKPQYESAHKEFVLFINHIIGSIAEFDDSVRGIEAKDCIFRIYRDTRFAKDKTPYKTNFGAYMAKGGRKGPFGGYYLHADPAGSFLAGGIYMPQPDVLKKIRTEIYYNPGEFLSIINNARFAETFGELSGDRLSRPPKDFSPDFEYIEYLKFKSYLVMKAIPEGTMFSDDLGSLSTNVFKILYPLNTFLNRAVTA